MCGSDPYACQCADLARKEAMYVAWAGLWLLLVHLLLLIFLLNFFLLHGVLGQESTQRPQCLWWHHIHVNSQHSTQRPFQDWLGSLGHLCLHLLCLHTQQSTHWPLAQSLTLLPPHLFRNLMEASPKMCCQCQTARLLQIVGGQVGWMGCQLWWESMPVKPYSMKHFSWQQVTRYTKLGCLITITPRELAKQTPHN